MNEALYYNALAVAVTGDRRKLVKLLKKYGGFERAYKKLRDGTLLGGGAARAAMPDAGAEWKKLGERSVRLIFAGEKGYPPLLAEIEDRPFGIYILGTFPRGDTAPCAIVGTRRATPEGKSIAHRFAHNLAQAGFPIVSGLAFGIDAAAHEGCLDARGTTVAVLAGGLDDVYPRENGRLAKRILESGGAIISEYPLGAPPYQDRFLERNRIISGCARGTLIVEAPVGSGALVTARLALEQNRDVFVVPGPITQPQFAGANQLIRQGAELVTAPEEICEAYGVTGEKKIALLAAAASEEEKLILEAMQEIGRPADVDKIAAAAKLEPRIVNRTLSFLLVKDCIKEKDGGYTI